MGTYFGAIWRLRHFWLALVRNDLRSRYRRSMLGVGWSLLHPIAMTIVLSVVFARMFQADIHTFAPFLLAGLVTWNFLSTVVSLGCQSFFMAESYIRQHPAPMAIYPLRTTLGAGIHFLLGLACVIVLGWCVNGLANLPVLLSLVPTLLLLFVLAWSLGICMGVVNLMFQDTQHVTEIALQILFYITPIIYPASMLRERGLDWFVDLNPFGAIMEMVREPILHAQLPPWSAVGTVAVTAMVMVALAAATLWRYERRIVFYL